MNRRSATIATIAVVTLVTAVFACGDDASNTSSNGSPDGRPTPDTTPAQGGGVCCPLEYPCRPGYRGGWAPTAEECPYDDNFDGRWDRTKDEHGCEQWTIGGGTAECCGCPIDRPDATPDASSDARDASSDAPDGD
jgi:hypothetical protein